MFMYNKINRKALVFEQEWENTVFIRRKPKKSDWSVKLNICFPLQPRLKMSGAILHIFFLFKSAIRVQSIL